MNAGTQGMRFKNKPDNSVYRRAGLLVRVQFNYPGGVHRRSESPPEDGKLYLSRRSKHTATLGGIRLRGGGLIRKNEGFPLSVKRIWRVGPDGEEKPIDAQR